MFSLALPHRTGSQCRHFYRHSRWFQSGEETASIPLAALRACLEQHKQTLSTLWTSPVAQQIQTRVDAWLRGERSPTSEPSIFAPPQVPSALATNKRKHSNGANDSKLPQHAAGGELPLRELKHERTAVQIDTQQPKKTKTLSSTKRGPPSSSRAAAAPRDISNGGLNRNKNSRLIRGGNGGGGRSVDDSSSEDEFIAGTLRKVKTVVQPASIEILLPGGAPTTNDTGTYNAGKAAALKGKTRAPRRRRPALLADGTPAVAIQQDFDEEEMEKMTIIRLDKESKLPGWVAREVTPYAASIGSSALTAAPTPILPEGSRIVFTKDVLTFNFASLGPETFTGVIINAPLSDDPQLGITVTQLSILGLADCLATNAIVCLWATKRHVGQAVTCMAKAWGCKYVENLTWVHIAPNGDVAKGPSTLMRTSHSTLVMGRRGGNGGGGGGGELELRHQRTPDVIVEPIRGGGKFPDSVREMMETLLPEPKHGKQQQSKAAGGGNGKTQQQQPEKEKVTGNRPRFLEISFHGAEPGVRSGWVKLVQNN
jgi:N6-adenosine-specific RNA methylase IME4